MALENIDTSSYNSFRTDALLKASQGLGYDADRYYGYQCWDLAAELWQNIGFGTGYPQTGANSYAMECWTNPTSRANNTGTVFTQVTNITDLKRGDVIVIGNSPVSTTGHIAFCDENYNGTTQMKLLGQNQVNPSPTLGHIPTVTELDISAFLGAFRYKAWSQAGVTRIRKVKHFPWAIYARRLREKRNNML